MVTHNKIGMALTLIVKDELGQDYRMYCKCNEFFNIATAKIIESSKVSVLFFENVPQFFASQAWVSLEGLINKDFPFGLKKIVAWDFGSVATINEPAPINT